MNSFIHLLLLTVVAAVLFASSDPTVAAAPVGEEGPSEPSKGDDNKSIFHIFRPDKTTPAGQGLLHSVGSGVKGILSSVREALGSSAFRKYYA